MSSSSVLHEARKLVHQFQARRFRPAQFFANEHLQTIVGSGALSVKLFGHRPRVFRTREREIETPDDDFFLVEFTENYDSARDVVIVVHGLESSSKSDMVSNMALAAMERGFACCLYNFRGCHGAENRTLRNYHVGFTQDLLQLIHTINTENPDKRIFLAGFSLGGNVILKLLGELKEQAKEKRIFGAAVFCVPFDPKGCQSKIDVGINRLLYSENFLATMKKKAERLNERFPGVIAIDQVRVAKTIGDYDEYVVAKIFGFADKFDYYQRCGSKFFLHAIAVPTIALNAIDDPFIEESSLPTPVDVGDAPVRLIYHQHGGHCGFLSRDETSPHGWIAVEIARCLAYFASSPEF